MTGFSEHDLLLLNNTYLSTPCDTKFEELMMKSTLLNNVSDHVIYVQYIMITSTTISCFAVIVGSCQFLIIIVRHRQLSYLYHQK